MSIPDENSTWCRNNKCCMYNVEGYCEECLTDFFNWMIKKGVKILRKDKYGYATSFEKHWKKWQKELEKKGKQNGQ